MKSGVPVDIKDENHPNLISTSIEGGHADIVKVLIEYGLDPNIEINRFGETPLMRAICENQKPIIQVLLSHGADADLADESGFTPLMSASAGGDVSTIELLVKHGADIGKKSDSERGQS